MSDKEKALEALNEIALLLEMNEYEAPRVALIRAALQDKPAPDLEKDISKHYYTILHAIDNKTATKEEIALAYESLNIIAPRQPHLITKEKLDRVEFHLNSAQVEIANGLNPSDEIEIALKILKGEW